jgi:hypothetical protein
MKKAVDNTTTVYAILLSWPEDSVLPSIKLTTTI